LKVFKVCETYPNGLPFHVLRGPEGFITLPEFKLPARVSLEQPPSSPSTPTARRARLALPTAIELLIRRDYLVRSKFSSLVRDYTSRQLTYSDIDKLAAFVGVAEYFGTNYKAAYYKSRGLTPRDIAAMPEHPTFFQRYHDVYQNEYLAGIFWRQLSHALLRRSTGIEIPTRSSGTLYRCPSWSWAKLDSSAEIPDMLPKRNEFLVNVIDAGVTLTDPASPYGRIKDARLKLRGRLKKFAWNQCLDMDDAERFRSFRHWKRGLSQPQEERFFPDFLAFDGVNESRVNRKRAWLLPISYRLVPCIGLDPGGRPRLGQHR
jgi:hypothetical protein